jgi:hypothetical protein
MTENASECVRDSVDAVYRTESRRVLATLIRLLAHVCGVWAGDAEKTQ